MRSFRVALSTVVVSLSLAGAPALADECRCLAVAADVTGALQAEVARADALYVHGDFAGAYAIYARAAASTKVPSLVYAQAMAKWRAGAAQEARALFSAYLELGGALAYRAQAESALGELGGRVGGATGAVGGAVGGVTGRVGGAVGAVPLVGGAAGATVGATGDVVGGVTGTVGGAAKPPKVARGAAIVLGVVAVAAVGAVGIHAIAAGIKDDISLDAKFDLGLGLTGVTVGITAIYVGGLTAATTAVGGVRCAGLPTRPVVAPVALPGGGGLVTAMAF